MKFRVVIYSMAMAMLATTSGCSNGGNGAGATADTQKVEWSLRMADSHGIGDFYCNTKHRDSLATTPWDYVSGLVASSLLEAWKLHPERTDLYEAVMAYADLATKEDGTGIQKYNGMDALGPSNIDDLAAARIYFDLYKEETKKGNNDKAARYKKAATLVRNKLKYEHRRIPQGMEGAGGFWHKMRYPNQMWLDGLFMGPAVYARWQAAWGSELGEEDNMASWADIAFQFKNLFAKTYDAEKHLNYHAWSADVDDVNSFWARKDGPNKGCNQEFWARAMGWYFGALVDVLELMPKDHPDYNDLLKIFQQTAEDLAARQDKKTGLWFNLLAHDESAQADGIGDLINGERYNVGTSHNYTETSASSMFSFVYMKGVRLGLLDKKFLQVGKTAFEGVLKNKVSDADNGKVNLNDICASAGLGPVSDPGRSGTLNYYLEGSDTKIVKSNEGKGVGAFILAATEYERL